MDLEQINQWVQIGVKADAVSHLLRVATGLESLMVGEPQILGQVKEAFSLAYEKQTTGVILDHLFKQAITFSKRMHTDYRVSELAQTSGQAGLHQIKATLKTLDDKKLVIVGLGQEGAHVLKNASTMGFNRILISNRTDMKAEKAASQYGSVVQMIPWQFVTSAVKNADAVILATSVEKALFKGNIFKTQDDKPKILIDLGVPRNVSKIGLPSTIIYLDIDHITQIIEQNQLYKQRMLDQIAKKVPKVVEQFYIWQKQLHVAPVIRELRESSLNIEKEVYDSLLRKLPELDAHERKVISKHMKSIINQMIKGPIKTIKELSVQADADSDLVFFCKLFGLSIDETILESLLLREADHSQTTTEQEKIYET